MPAYPTRYLKHVHSPGFRTRRGCNIPRVTCTAQMQTGTVHVAPATALTAAEKAHTEDVTPQIAAIISCTCPFDLNATIYEKWRSHYRKGAGPQTNIDYWNTAFGSWANYFVNEVNSFGTWAKVFRKSGECVSEIRKPLFLFFSLLFSFFSRTTFFLCLEKPTLWQNLEY